jgi:hypothetical protein
VALLLGLGFSAGFGWGTLTHIYFANHLGVKFGPFNQNEIYGAVLPDLFGYDFTPPGFTADYLFHTSADVYGLLYGSAVSRPAKAAFYGVFTHSNIDGNLKGADWYAHGVYPEPGNSPDPNGWVIEQGFTLIGNNAEIPEYVYGLLGDRTLPGNSQILAADAFLSVVGHTLVETAVDILVRRHEDPLAGARLLLAAKHRSNDVPRVLAGVFGSIPGCPTAMEIVEAEAVYRQQMMGYGQLFLLPERQLIDQISEQTIGVAQMFFIQVLGVPQNELPQFEKNKIVEFIKLAIKQVEPAYHKELMFTLCNVEKNMKKFGPPPAGPIFAFFKDDDLDLELEKAGISVGTPTDFALAQNYPNPFNPSTNISYSLPADAHVSLKVYNSLGQEVASLVDEARPAGLHVAVWDASGMASGVYFYRLQAGSYGETKRMTLLK